MIWVDKEEIKKLAGLLYELMRENKLSEVGDVLLDSLEKERTDKLGIVRTPTLNSIGRELGKLIVGEDWKFERLLRLWKMSFESVGGREIRYIIINALGVISKTDYDGSKKFVLSVLNDLSDWESVDALALRVIVNLAKQNKQEIFLLLKEWVGSKNKWVRRLAMATIAPYIRAKPKDAEPCLGIIEKLMEEKDRDVRKAIAWALREVSKKNPKIVYEFLRRYVDSTDANTRWIVKEGSKKLPKNCRDKLNV